MTQKNSNHISELIPAYALGILSREEEWSVTQHLQQCASCQAELESYQDVVSMLPLAVVEKEPAPHLKERLMQKIRQESPSSPKESWLISLVKHVQAMFPRPLWQPALAIVTILLVVSASLWWQSQTAVSSNILQTIPLNSTELTFPAQGQITQNSEATTLLVSGLPSLSEDQVYQLWFFADDAILPSVTFAVAEDGSTQVQIQHSQPLEAYDGFGITIEPAGGSPAPTSDPILLSDL